MRVVYYTRPSFLDTALPFVRDISRLVELHLLLELSPEAWRTGLLDAAPKELPTGIVPADPVLKGCFPAGVRAYWKDVASFNLVVHNSRRSIHPRTWWTSHGAAGFIRSLNPHVLHLDDVSLRLAWALLELGNLPTVLSIHDPEPHSGEANWRQTLARRMTFRRVRQFILHSEALVEPFCRKYDIPESQVQVVPLGVYDVYREWTDSRVTEDPMMVLFFGRLSPYKGLRVLYEAASLAARQVRNIRLVVAGRPIASYQPPVPPELPNGGCVEFIDRYISNSELASLFQRAAFVVCPYTDATQSGVVLTAYAFGKPVVATRTGGLPEYVIDGESGLLVAPSDVEALSDALVKLLHDPELQGRLMEGTNRLRSGTLDWKGIALRTIDSYERTMRS